MNRPLVTQLWRQDVLGARFESLELPLAHDDEGPVVARFVVYPSHRRLQRIRHRTPGVATLWADRNPGAVGTLILNAPWLELQGSSLVGNIAMQLLEPLARTDPRRPLLQPSLPGYWDSVSGTAHGEWALNAAWRPRASFPIGGWTKRSWPVTRRCSAVSASCPRAGDAVRTHPPPSRLVTAADGGGHRH